MVKLKTSDLFYWLALNRISLVGPASFVKLIDHFGLAEKIFTSGAPALFSVPGIKKSVAEAVLSFRDFDNVEKEYALLVREGTGILTYLDKAYPLRLKQIPSFPPMLFVLGNADCLNEGEWLAVVGSRDATEYGIMACRRIVRELAANGIRIVSGFARGIDITAHETVFECNGVTVGVLGGGFFCVHPAENRRYIKKIAERGALVSEFSPSVTPRPEFFPRRNRIISGLGRGVLVVEAGEKSGAMITARYALDHNRDLYTVPGSIFSAKSRGCHKLIREGAFLVNEAVDILNDWQYANSAPKAPAIEDPGENLVYSACLGRDPLTPDEIVEKTGFDASCVTMFLTKLELSGKIKSLPGKRYQSM